MSPLNWRTLILECADPTLCWEKIADAALESAKTAQTPAQLHNLLQPLDRILADAAWDLWESFPVCFPTTAETLKRWWQAPKAATGRAVLILDGLSLRELPLLLSLLESHIIAPLDVRVTGAEVPTDTDHFAAALGLSGRSALKHNEAPAGFILQSDDLYTDVAGDPFADCIHDIPARNDIIIWHTWPDDLFKSKARDVTDLERTIQQGLTSPGFWELLMKLRQGRQLVITSDHGYANTKNFPVEEMGDVKDYLADHFGAMRMTLSKSPLPTKFFPPLALTFNGWDVVLGQRHWKVTGGYPFICHGGLTLLEAFSPYIIIPEVH